MASRAAPNLIPRLLDYLMRLADWMGQVQRDLLRLEEESGEADYDRLEIEQQRREEQQRHFQREYNGLRDEWRRAQDIPEDQRERVRQESAKVQALAAQLAQLYERCAKNLEHEKAVHKRALDAVRRGKTMMAKYRSAGADIAPGFIDRDA